MGSPSSSLATLRPDLAAAFEEFPLEMDRRGFIGLQVAPVIDVALASNTFSKVPIEQLLQNPDTARAPGSGYGRGRFTFSKDTYATEENGWEEPVDDNESAMYANYVDSEMLAARRAYDAVLRNHEKRVADLIFNTTTWTGATLTTALLNEWDDYANATAVADVEAAVRTIYENSGVWANAIILPKSAFRDLRQHDEIIDRVKYSGFQDPTTKGITTSVLAQLFDLQYVLVAGGTKNTADAGQAASLSSIWNADRAMVCHINPTPDTRLPSLARTFHWGGDGSEVQGAFDSYREEQTRSEIIRVRHQTDEKVMYTELGHLLTNLTT